MCITSCDWKQVAGSCVFHCVHTTNINYCLQQAVVLMHCSSFNAAGHMQAPGAMQMSKQQYRRFISWIPLISGADDTLTSPRA